MTPRTLIPTFVALLVLAQRVVADPSPEAAQLYHDGQIAYDAARYDDAIAAWQRSYDLSRATGLLYNIAQAHRLRAHAGDCPEARDAYRQFVDATPPSPQRELAAHYLVVLGDCPAPVTTSATAAGSSSPLRGREIASIALTGGGAVVLITGLALGAHASSLGNQVTSACAMHCDWPTERTIQSTGQLDATLGRTFDVLGLAALAGGAALYYFGIRGADVHVTPVAIRAHDTGAVVSWGRAW